MTKFVLKGRPVNEVKDETRYSVLYLYTHTSYLLPFYIHIIHKVSNALISHRKIGERRHACASQCRHMIHSI